MVERILSVHDFLREFEIQIPVQKSAGEKCEEVDNFGDQVELNDSWFLFWDPP